MVILKLYGDEWQLDEKIVVALGATKTFASQLALVTNKLGADDFNGLCFYRTEGRPPNFIRHTVPISINSCPQREKMLDGTILYVKAADLRQQERDRQFQESLEAFRKDNGFDGLQKDGSDVAKFKEWISSHLNVAEYKDISEAEDSSRSKIEVAEFRTFRDITFELRDVQDMKDNESRGRNELFAEFRSDIAAWYHDMIVVPLSREAFTKLIAAETAARALAIQEVDADRQTIMGKSISDKKAIDSAVAKRLAEERAAEDRRRREEEERQRLLRLEEERKERAEAEAKARELEMLKLMQQQQQRFADPEEVKQIVNDAVDASSAELQTRIEREVSKVTDNLRTFVAGEMKESRDRFDQLLSYLLPFKNAAVAASFGAQLTHNAQLINMYDDHVTELGKQIEARVDSTKWALETHRKREAAAETQCKALADEQKQLLEAIESKDREENEQRDLEERVLAAQTGRTMSALYEGILSSRTLLDAIALDHQRTQLMNDVKIAATAASYRSLLAARVAELERNHPRIYGNCFPLDKEPDMPSIDVDAHAILCVFAERYGVTDAALDDLVLKYNCAWRVADELVLRTGMPATTSTQYDFARPHIEEHAPNLRPVLDLLLDIYTGREVELVAAVVSSSNSDREWNKPDNFIEGQDGEKGSPLQRTFYFHKQLQRSQWMMPRCWET